MCVAKFVEKFVHTHWLANLHSPATLAHTHTHTHTHHLYLVWYLFCACFEYNERKVNERAGIIILCVTRISLQGISIVRLRTVDCACTTELCQNIGLVI